ncbi:MAG: hypothetical protein RL749_1601, partial [Verrucomicrobiota bacterium]
MTPFWRRLTQQVGDAAFAFLPTLPYSRPDKQDCAGEAVVARGLSAGARADGPPAFREADFSIPCGCRTALIGP